MWVISRYGKFVLEFYVRNYKEYSNRKDPEAIISNGDAIKIYDGRNGVGHDSALTAKVHVLIH